MKHPRTVFCAAFVIVAACAAAPPDGPPVELLTGRVLDVEGNVISDTGIEYSIAALDGDTVRNERVPLPLVTSGRFRIAIEPWMHQGVMVILDSRLSRGELIDLYRLQGTSLDLGDVTLRALPVLATGVVRDLGGAVVGGCRVWAEEPATYAAGEEPADWLEIAQDLSDPDGSFTLRGWTAVGWFRVQAMNGEGCSNTAMADTPRDRELQALTALGYVAPDSWTPEMELVIGKTGRIEGRLVAGPSLDGLNIFATLLPGRSQGGRVMVSVSSDGRFVLTDLAPGTYLVEVRERANPQPLWSARVEVASDLTTRDSRLQDIDLGARR